MNAQVKYHDNYQYKTLSRLFTEVLCSVNSLWTAQKELLLQWDMHCFKGTAGFVRGMDYARKQAAA